MRSLLEKYPADWLNQLGLIHGEPVRVINSDLSSVTAEADKVIRVEVYSPGWSTSSSRRMTIVHFLGDSSAQCAVEREA